MFNKSIQKYSFFDKQNNHTFASQNSSVLTKRPSNILLTSNSMASFTGTIDAYQNTMVFAKLHQNHLKYSMNWLEGSQR